VKRRQLQTLMKKNNKDRRFLNVDVSKSRMMLLLALGDSVCSQVESISATQIAWLVSWQLIRGRGISVLLPYFGYLCFIWDDINDVTDDDDFDDNSVCCHRLCFS
jgi:hypothetical protein